METETISKILNSPISLWAGIVLTLCGMFFYYMTEAIGTGKSIKKFSDIKLGSWWANNQIRFVMICMVITIIFYLSSMYDELTAEHCLELGIVGNMFLDKFLTRMKVGNTQGNSGEN